MKAIKFIALLLILGIVSYGYAQQEGPTDQKPDPRTNSFAIYLHKAMQNPALVRSMYQQLNPGFLKVEQPRYTERVIHQRKAVYITGTYEQWKKFFRIDVVDDPQGKLKPEIPLREAMAIPQLVAAMRAQLTPDFLKLDKPCYTEAVRYKHSVVYVTASLNEWKWFFRMKIKADLNR